MKKIIASALVLLIVIGSLGVLTADASKWITSGDWRYEIMDDGNAKIVSYCGESKSAEIPEYIDGYKITTISSIRKLEELKIGKNINKIVANGFTVNKALKKITVDKDNKFFSSKDGLLLNKEQTKLVLYPNSKASSFKLPKTVKYIGKDACAYNEKIKKLVIPKTVKRIGNGAFSFCESITSVKLPKTVKYIGDNAFSFCSKLNAITFEKGTKLKMGASVFSYCDSLKKVSLPHILETKSNNSMIFEGCKNLKKVIIPNGTKFIPTACFIYCPKLKSVTIPSSVEKIGELAFGFIMGDYTDKFNKSFVIKGKKGSAAEKYAKANKLKFKAI